MELPILTHPNSVMYIKNIYNILAGVQERGGDGVVKNDSLRNLSVYLLLQKAEAAGFKAEDYNLNGDQVATIATVFNKYDLNDDFVLSTTEVNTLL